MLPYRAERTSKKTRSEPTFPLGTKVSILCALSWLLPHYLSDCELAYPLQADSGLTALARQ
jgi:hypothetical protein